MNNTATFKRMKANREKIAMMTAYDAPGASALNNAGMDLVLVGDSAGMVVHGYSSTIPVTLDDMVLHTRAVKRGAPHLFTVSDMPFLTYNGDITDTIQAAAKLMQTGGADAVKVEGAGATIEVISRLVHAGVPVMAHLGLTPQSVGVIGGYKVQGKNEAEAQQLIEDAVAIEKAGAFALVLECVPYLLAGYITSKLSIPVIGIGAGSETDGQVLVYHDALGIGEGFVPKFVKKYAEVQQEIDKALLQYIKEVKSSVFPDSNHSFKMDEDLADRLYGGMTK
ncbi:3-methyl-2-oxobutanoate hydroxymethyltransferase [Alteribacillus sp. HJP-4]|uniref:3-methyl-2-oxobutanoate hydroxymethyltransferase n=1 Tax=Alteribacillus sp. HJP-4 TaxID=2775394 RepID=UPI0035CCFC6C